jgi:hypothetical protein
VRTRGMSYFGKAFGVTMFLVASLVGVSAWQLTAQTLTVDDNDLVGTVTGRNGPEAGVWVIAETTDLPTRFVRIVVTDDQGRYALPDLPRANYLVWVRGYGLVDSPKIQTTPGRTLDLTAVIAPTPLAAAQYYPSGYWHSLVNVPGPEEFPGTGDEGNGISPAMTSQAMFVRHLKTSDCWGCHQIGTKVTREFPAHLGPIENSLDAWARRIQAGQAGSEMIGQMGRLGAQRALAMYAEWTDRIAAGEVPPAPPRPQGVERNIVVTLWDWADPFAYLHDEVSTDRRNPTVNANGPIYGATEHSTDYVPVLDPVRHTASRLDLAPRDPNTQPSWPPTMPAPSWFYGNEVMWSSRINVHNPMFDQRGRVWMTFSVRPPENPAFCREGSSHPSAQLFPTNRATRHLAVYDPQSGELTQVSTCFGTHHLMFAEDANNTIWTSGGGEVVG